ncbi:hypothetical protein HOD75_01230 [archaeon]|jgi:hypothetical protein|nr:hypothetical protein [archaeon]MBT4241501.1 hypothetical protein [archaeon]MBT4417628.1 hypothetical protein [archaeon]
MLPRQQKLYERLKGRQVQEVLISVTGDLARLEPDGKTIHNRKGIQNALKTNAYVCQELYGENLTLEQLRKRKPTISNNSIDMIAEAIVIFGITI